MFLKRSRRYGQLWRRVSFIVPVVLLMSGVGQLPALAKDAKGLTLPGAVAGTPGSYVKPAKPVTDPTASQRMHAPHAVVWPAAATATIDLTAAGGAQARAMTASGPVTLAEVSGTPFAVGAAPTPAGGAGRALALLAGAPGSVRVQVLDHATATGVGRVVVARINRADGVSQAGSVAVGLNYAAFRDAYGGDWSNRLRLVQLPDCALTTPDAAACQAVDLGGVNDPATATVTATVTLNATSVTSGMSAADALVTQPAGAVVALASGPQSTTGGGDYTATALSPASSWTAGSGSGDFDWSYPVNTPPGLGGPTPGVGVMYSSQSVDGKVAASNNQPSWVGEGFDYAPGMISRSYAACADDGKSGVGDQCWKTDNATLTLPGHAGELIQVSTSPDVWKPKVDDGTKVERLTGAANGARNGEYWKVTTTDGTQYFFGLGQLPGWSANKPVTSSVYTEPVFGNNSGEPCYNATYASAWCIQAYQWNLDYVLDVHGNSMSYWYSQETNHYARNVTAGTVSAYTRSGNVDHIDYGTRQDNGVDSDYSDGHAPAQVKFDTVGRCVTAGSTCVQTNPGNWPDVPWDQQCDSTTSCPTVFAPTYFSTRMLSTITTKVWDTAGAAYTNVEQVAFRYEFKDPGDSHQKILWLDGITDIGLSFGQHTTTPEITFTAVQLNNRVDKSASKDPIIRYRLSTITNEAGGVVAVTYSQPECVTGTNMPASADTNTKRCFPVWWTPYGTTTATFDWFHKYVVTGVTAYDGMGHNGTDTYTYTYIGSPAWHYDDNEIIPANHRSWGQWRGYGEVRVLHGDGTSAQIQTDTFYFRGMNGDKTSTGTRTVTVPADADFGGAAINDENWRAGQTRESIVYNGVGDSAPVVSKTLYEPWESGPTVTRTRNGVTVASYITNVRSITTKTKLDGNRGWLTTKSTNTFDVDDGTPNPTGLITKVFDDGDITTTADDQCTTNTYASNAAANIFGQVAEARKVGVACTATPNLATDVISDQRTWYDGAATFGTSVSKGEISRTEVLDHYTGSTPVYVTKAIADFDIYGRVLDSWDTADHHTSTTYTPAAGAQPTSVDTKSPAGWTSTNYLDPGTGLTTASVDVNGKRTDQTYDGLGRLTAVWLPGRDKATQTASQTYTYNMGGSAAVTSVATATLNTDGSGYVTTYQVYDGFLRKRQTQTPGPNGGALFTDILYDTRGLAVQANDSYYNSGVSWGTLYVPTGAVAGRALTTYDNAGRATDVIFQVNGVEKWRTTTAFGGDHTNVTAPLGGQAATVWKNALNQTTQLWQYHSNTPTPTVAGSYDVTTYGYNSRGQTTSITDQAPAGSTWSFTFDQRGRNTQVSDPDKGQITYTYNDLDQQETATDGANNLLSTVYDDLGRITQLWSGAVNTGTLLSATSYDSILKGNADTTTTYAGGNAYTSSVLQYDPAGRPTKTEAVIPAAENGLAGTFDTTINYNANGSVHDTTLPAIGGASGLAAETLTYGYNSVGMPNSVTGTSGYQATTTYDNLGRISVAQNTDGGAKTALQMWVYETGTNRLLEHGTEDKITQAVFQDMYYTYDNAGNVKSIKDLTNQYGAGPDDNQCFTYDYASRLTQAFTPAGGNCTTSPTVAGLGGPAPYWQNWTYDTAGDRKTQTTHASAGDSVDTYNYPAATATRPHAVTSITTTGPGAGTSTSTYDNAGNTTGRNQAGKPGQTLTWNAQGRLATVTDTSGTTTYTYDTGGSRLITHDPQGVTLHLGNQELRIPNTGATTATRFYGDAVRTNTGGLNWTITDTHGSNDLTLTAATLTKTQRRTNPFGAARGTTPSWISDRGFVGGITDTNNGLTQLGARFYDPNQGRFESVDPEFDAADPQSFNGYAYAHNNPCTNSDPGGLSDFTPAASWQLQGYTDSTETSGIFFLCQANGLCQGRHDNFVEVGYQYWCKPGAPCSRDFIFRVEIRNLSKPPTSGANGTGNGGSPTRLPASKPKPQASQCYIPPPPPPVKKCDFLDFNCAFTDWGAYWSVNKGDIETGLAVAGGVACVVVSAGACTAIMAASSLISAGQRMYDFSNSGNYSAAAIGGLVLGLGMDALGAVPGEGSAASAAENIVYRNIREDEDHLVGLVAKNPDANYQVSGHITNGSKVGFKSQYISTTRSLAVAQKWSQGRTVAIDLNKFDGQVIDLSTLELRAGYPLQGATANRLAASSAEVLLVGSVPPEAITWIGMP